jgi:hypothetical protein
MKRFTFHLPRISAILVASIVAASAQALEITANVGYQAEYTDNTEQTPDDEINEWIQSPEATLLVNHDGPSTFVEVDYRARREIHQEVSSLDQTIVDGNALLTWQAIANRLKFDVSNTRTQTTIDSRGQDVQDNLQVTNTAQGGATLTLDSFGNQRFELGYHFADVNADKTSTDSQRQLGDASYVIPISSEQRVQLNGSITDVNFEESAASDFVSREGDVQYVYDGDVLDVDMRIGYTVVDLQDLNDTQGTTGDISIVWSATGATHLTVSYSRAIDDGAVDADMGIPQFGENFDNSNSDLTQPYTIDEANLSLDTQLGHNDVELIGYYRDQNYDSIDRNQDTTGGRLVFSRKLRPTLTARLFGDISKTDYQDQGQRDDDLRSALELEWTRWRRLTVSGSAAYTRRNSNLAGVEFREWSGTIRIMYTVLGQGR